MKIIMILLVFALLVVPTVSATKIFCLNDTVVYSYSEVIYLETDVSTQGAIVLFFNNSQETLNKAVIEMDDGFLIRVERERGIEFNDGKNTITIETNKSSIGLVYELLHPSSKLSLWNQDRMFQKHINTVKFTRPFYVDSTLDDEDLCRIPVTMATVYLPDDMLAFDILPTPQIYREQNMLDIVTPGTELPFISQGSLYWRFEDKKDSFKDGYVIKFRYSPKTSVMEKLGIIVIIIALGTFVYSIFKYVKKNEKKD